MKGRKKGETFKTIRQKKNLRRSNIENKGSGRNPQKGRRENLEGLLEKN